MTIAAWLAHATDDADRRHRPDLRPVLEGLADAMRVLRDAGWHEPPRPTRPDTAEPR